MDGDDATSASGGRRRLLRWGAMITAVLLLAFVPVWYFFIRGVPLLDEWVCADGEAPTVFEGGGAACEKFTSFDVPPREGTWDPLGNRPFSCHHRYGWTEIRKVGDDQDIQCLKRGMAVPDGYEKVG